MDHPDTTSRCSLNLRQAVEYPAHFAIVVFVGIVQDIEYVKNCELGPERLQGFGKVLGRKPLGLLLDFLKEFLS